MKFSERLLNAMEFRKLNANQLANKCGFSRSLISKWVHDKSKPNQNGIYLLSKYLDISPSYLLGITNEMLQKEPSYNDVIKEITNDLKYLKDEQLQMIKTMVKSIKKENMKT